MKVFSFRVDYMPCIGWSKYASELRFVLSTDKGQFGFRRIINELPHEQSLIDYIFDHAKEEFIKAHKEKIK